MFVGARGDDTGFTDSGLTYVFDAETAQLLQTLANPRPSSGDAFGHSVSVWGSRLVISAPFEDGTTYDRGAVHIFESLSGVSAPAAPTNFAAMTTGTNSAQVTWVDNSVNETGFRVERFDGHGFVTIALVAANATSVEVKKLESSAANELRVRSFNSGGTSTPSNTAIATTPQLVVINGTAGEDTFHVIRSGSKLYVYESTDPIGQPAYLSELAALGATVTINAAGGNDALFVNSGGQSSLGVGNSSMLRQEAPIL
ncbi:MAG: fibronectin type III domain-containing protein [Pirellulales bacterium]